MRIHHGNKRLLVVQLGPCGKESNATTPPTEYFATILAIISSAFALLVLFGSYLVALGGVRASKRLHSEVISHVLFAPLHWFETGSTGRILSRFSGDLCRVDIYLSQAVDNSLQMSINFLVLIVTVCIIISPYLAIVAVFSISCSLVLLVAIDRTLREARRIANAALSPVMTNGRNMLRCVKLLERSVQTNGTR